MPVAFYDNLEATPVIDEPGNVEVERIYIFDWSRFTEAHWQELSRIYKALPGAVRYQNIPYWFGDDETIPPFLWASVEPSGLQVYGVLPLGEWTAWNERLQSESGELPMRVLE